MGNIRRIDPHVHCRDGVESYKSTIARVFEIADSQGVGIIFDMPNTSPPLLTGGAVAQRMSLVPRERRNSYFVWMGMTSDPNQIELAVRSYDNNFKIVGFKLYAGPSTRNLEVAGLEHQKKVYETLARCGYQGVLAVHCERKDLLRPELWTPSNPMSHSWARPKEAEIKGVEDQIRIAKEIGFEGNLHIVHVSCPESVSLVKQAKLQGMRITCEVAPHHLMYSVEIQRGQRAGSIWKMNPPLRDLETVKALQACLLIGEIDWLATDHAPHSLDEKLSDSPPSGFPSLCIYRETVEDFLPAIDVFPDFIQRMTFDNIVEVFGDRIGGAL